MNNVFMFQENDYRLYLMHHGVPGQVHGVRRAAWYPIAAWEASRRAAGKVKDVIEKRAAAKAEEERIKKVREKRTAAIEKAKQTRAENKAREADEKERQEEESRKKTEQERVLTSGTKEELMKLVGQVDNALLSNAIQNRINLDEKVKAITPEKVSKYEKYLDKAVKIGVTAKKVGDVAQDLSSAYKNVSGLLKAIGVIEDKTPKVKSYKDADAIKQDIYKKILSGQIKPEEYSKYQNAISSLDTLAKQANAKKTSDRNINERSLEELKIVDKTNEEKFAKERKQREEETARRKEREAREREEAKRLSEQRMADIERENKRREFKSTERLNKLGEKIAKKNAKIMKQAEKDRERIEKTQKQYEEKRKKSSS